MVWDDLKKLFTSTTLVRLDTVLGARLVPLLFALGLCAIGLWAIYHLFASFAFNFGQGLWGIVEIIVYVPLAIIALRLVCEMLQIYFRVHESAAAAVNRGRISRPLIDEVGDAIHDLADADDDEIYPTTETASSRDAPGDDDIKDTKPARRGPVVKRTAKRSPPPKPPAAS